MEFPPEKLGHLTLFGIICEAFSIILKFPKDFLLITLSIISPLSLGICAPSIYTILPRAAHRHLIIWGIILLVYIPFLYIFTMFSTRAVAFMVTSHYTSNPASSFSFRKFAIPRKGGAFSFIFSFAIILIVPCLAFLCSIFTIAIFIEAHPLIAAITTTGINCVMLYFYTLVSLLPPVISIIEPVKNCAEPLSKGRHLLRGKTWSAIAHMFIYLTVCMTIMGAFSVLVNRPNFRISERIIIGSLLCELLAIVLLVGLTIQCVFYFVCKSHHQQEINKNAICSFLGLDSESCCSSEVAPGKNNIRNVESQV